MDVYAAAGENGRIFVITIYFLDSIMNLNFDDCCGCILSRSKIAAHTAPNRRRSRYGDWHSMPESNYLKPLPAFDKAGKFIALVVGNARHTKGRSAAAVAIWPADQPEAYRINRRPSNGFESDSWRADVGSIKAAVALTPPESDLTIYTANEDLADRANRLFKDDQRALFRTSGKNVVDSEVLSLANEDRKERNIKVRVEHRGKDDPEFRRLREDLKSGNRDAMSVCV